MTLTIQHWDLTPYPIVYEAMKRQTMHSDASSPDQLWLVQHPAVFTQGRHGRSEHLLNPDPIPICHTDRGGQVTYHGPGQAVIYFLFNLKRQRIGIKKFVFLIEQAGIDMLQTFQINATRRHDAPGLYVQGAKIASLGLRVKNGRTYHGIAINTAMDLTPFNKINPCGMARLPMCQIKDMYEQVTVDMVFQRYCQAFKRLLSTI